MSTSPRGARRLSIFNMLWVSSFTHILLLWVKLYTCHDGQGFIYIVCCIWDIDGTRSRFGAPQSFKPRMVFVTYRAKAVILSFPWLFCFYNVHVCHIQLVYVVHNQKGFTLRVSVCAREVPVYVSFYIFLLYTNTFEC